MREENDRCTEIRVLCVRIIFIAGGERSLYWDLGWIDQDSGWIVSRIILLREENDWCTGTFFDSVDQSLRKIMTLTSTSGRIIFIEGGE